MMKGEICLWERRGVCGMTGYRIEDSDCEKCYAFTPKPEKVGA